MAKQKKILEYLAIFQEEAEGGYSVWIPSLPGCASQGDSFEEAQKNITEALELYLQEESAENIDTGAEKQFAVPVKIAYA